MPQANMREIAGRAGVSLATVSYVLNDTSGAQIGADTRQRVMAIANELGYHRSLLGRSIKQRLRHIGVAVGSPDPTEQTYTAELFAGIREQTLAAGYFPVLQPMPNQIGQTDGSEVVRRMLDLHRSKLIDGFIIDKAPFLTVTTVELFERGVPIVLVNSGPNVATRAGEHMPMVNVNNYSGARAITEHLVSLGHRRIGLILPATSGNPLQPTAFRLTEVIRGYREVLAAAGAVVNDDLIREGHLADRDTNERVVRQLMKLRPAPTAFFAVDDAIAVMAIIALRRMGLQVPHDISVAGFGDWPIVNRLAEPPLTTVHTPLRYNGELAAKLLIDTLEGSAVSETQLVVEPELQIRQSTAPPRESPGGDKGDS